MPNFKKILIAEDNQYDVELIMEVFTENNLSNNIMVVNDGQEALDYLYRQGKFAERQDGNPVVVLLDIKMPKLTGIDVLKVIKSDPDLKNLPVVMLTSSRDENDLVESYKLGVNGYVVKPVDIEQFIKAVSTLGLFWAVFNEPPPY
jgi:CheY-like chemotaxis protein